MKSADLIIQPDVIMDQKRYVRSEQRVQGSVERSLTRGRSMLKLLANA